MQVILAMELEKMMMTMMMEPLYIFGREFVNYYDHIDTWARECTYFALPPAYPLFMTYTSPGQLTMITGATHNLLGKRLPSSEKGHIVGFSLATYTSLHDKR